MFLRRLPTVPTNAGRLPRFLPLILLLLVAAGLLLVAGCGGGSDDQKAKDDVVLAVVGDKDITSSYYEDRLALLEEKELPRGDDGLPLDMSQMEGKREFLQTLINKELMYRKAMQLGYDADPQVVGLRESMTSYEAGLALWADVVGDPTSTVTPEQLEAFYARMGEIRDCKFLITNFKDDAEAARAMAQGGAPWDEVVAKYHDGSKPPSGKYEITIPYGRYNTDFDADVFETEIGGVAPPIASSYGYWVLKVTGVRETSKPELEAAKAQILDITRNRMIGERRKEFIESVREKYDFFIDEDVLWICYQGLPKDEVLLDAETKQPTPRDQLKPLEIAPADLDKIFYGYKMDGELKQYTLGDYKTHFDRMSVFQRPKYGEMLGGLREKVTAELDKALLNREAQARGFFEAPEVVKKVDAKVEEVMVTKLYDDVVTFDDKISPEALDEFWREHESEYFLPESASGRLVVCRNIESARAARADIEGGMKWKGVLTKYGTDSENKSRSGKLDRIPRNGPGAIAEAMSGMTAGQISEPILLENGRYGIVRVDTVEPGRQQTLDETRENVGERIRNLRREEAFQTLLAQWAEEFGVTRYEDRLAEVASWKELTAVELPGELLPRK